MRLVLYTGKGGVGKTTTAAATAVCAARRGLRTLVVSVDPAHSLGDVLGARLGAAPSPVEARLLASEIDARRELDAHWSSVRDGIAALLRGRVADERVVEDLAILPGAE
ncbi:MAG: AAA family ATPase, partial [Myxococcales bacterium]|nr:AAA family ATPase [Myxococcales bacterium]